MPLKRKKKYPNRFVIAHSNLFINFSFSYTPCALVNGSLGSGVLFHSSFYCFCCNLPNNNESYVDCVWS